MGRLLLFLLIYGVLAVPANAAGLGELTPLSVHGSEDCAGPTGAPGELVTRTTTGVRFVTVTRTGFQPGQALELGKRFTCSAVKVRPSGAGVVVGQLDGKVIAVVRDPGGAWSAPLTVAEATDLGFAVQVTADVSDRGDAIVGLKVTRLDGIDVANPTSEFRVARRAPGGLFGASERIGEAATSIGAIVSGIAATGEAFVVTSRAPTNRRPPFRVPVDVRIAPPGGAFGVPVHVTDTHLLSTPALAVAADGRALIAVPESDKIVVAERAPGTGFGAATPIGPAGEGAFTSAFVALGAGGAAAVAWTRLLPTDVQVVTRSAPGTFSPPIVAVDAPAALPAGSDPFFLSESFFGAISPIGFFFSGLWTPLTITPDGRAVLAFKEGPRASLTSVPLAGGPVVAATTGNGFDTSADAAALVLADGNPAVTWTQSAEAASKA